MQNTNVHEDKSNETVSIYFQVASVKDFLANKDFS